MQRYACNVTPLATAPDRRTREFDLVVLDPDTFGTGIVGTGIVGTGIEGTVDGSVAMTRATQQLVILTST
jgi:23S rRNA G2069 N7-methylase RlmK/C1962 C5-methylase RlmI